MAQHRATKSVEEHLRAEDKSQYPFNVSMANTFSKNIANTPAKRDLIETEAISDTGGKDEKKQRTRFRLKTLAEIWNFTSKTERNRR